MSIRTAAREVAVAALTGLAVVGACVALCGCTSSAAPAVPRSTAPIELVVLHTNDLWGETRPCG